MGKHKFEIIGVFKQKIEVEEPHAVFAYQEITRLADISDVGSDDNKKVIIANEEIENPLTSNFLILLEKNEHKRWCAVLVGDNIPQEYRDVTLDLDWRTEIVIGKFSKMSIPLVKKVYPMLLASQLVGVQPMTAPSSLLYYLRYRYAQAKKSTN